MYTVVGCNKLGDANNHLGLVCSLHLLFNGRGGTPTFPQVLVCLPETNPIDQGSARTLSCSKLAPQFSSAWTLSNSIIVSASRRS